MARPRSRTPSYRFHKVSGHAYSDYTDPLTGRRRSVCLGPWDSEESRVAHATLCIEVSTSGPPPADDLSVAELLLRYLKHAEGYYVKDGQPTDEIPCIKAALRPVRELYAFQPAAVFGPLELKAVQAKMTTNGWTRKVVNKHVGRVKRAWRWAVAEGMVPPETLIGLEAVSALKKGRTSARESAGVSAVPDAMVEATLPHLSVVVGAMVRLQRLTGMRPDEVCRLRPCDLDRSAEVWVYTPAGHKTEHLGRQRVVAVGPKAQAVLAPFLKRDPASYCFSPKEAVEEVRSKLRTKKKLGASSRPKGRGEVRRAARDRYAADSYRVAVQRACDVAFPPDPPLGPMKGESLRAWQRRLTEAQKKDLLTWRQKHRWFPNQLRHAAATELRKHFGLEAARVVLGHSDLKTSEIYAARDTAAAVEAARLLG